MSDEPPDDAMCYYTIWFASPDKAFLKGVCDTREQAVEMVREWDRSGFISYWKRHWLETLPNVARSPQETPACC